jgi:hypothetical protein
VKKAGAIALAAAMLLLLPQMILAEPASLSDAEMEQVYAQGISINGGTLVGLSDSAVASDGSSALDDVTDSNVQVGSGNTQTGQNQLNTENAEVEGGDSEVINIGGDNRDQVNLTKSVYIDEGAQNYNSGVIGNTAQGIFLQPINAITVQSGSMNGDLNLSNTNTTMMVNY